MNLKFDVIVPVRCFYCGHMEDFNITDYSRRATRINTNFSWVCPKCKSVATPIFRCDLKWVSRQ